MLSVTISNLHLTKEPDAIEEATSVPTEDELKVPLITEKSSDEVTDKNIETQMDFKEVDANTENIQFGKLSVLKYDFYLQRKV